MTVAGQSIDLSTANKLAAARPEPRLGQLARYLQHKKRLPDAFANHPDRLTRFEREAHVLASLNHPHIAVIYGFEEARPQPADRPCARLRSNSSMVSY